MSRSILNRCPAWIERSEIAKHALHPEPLEDHFRAIGEEDHHVLVVNGRDIGIHVDQAAVWIRDE